MRVARGRVDQQQQLAERRALGDAAYHQPTQRVGADGVQMRGAVVDTHFEAAGQRGLGDRCVRLDPVRVDTRAHQSREQCAVAALDDRDPPRAAAQRLGHVVLPDRVVAMGDHPRADAPGASRVAGDVLELDDASAQQPQRGVDRGGQRGDLLGEPDVVPAEQFRHDALDDAERGAVRRDRDHRVDDHEILGPFERGVEVVAHLGGRESIEKPVELALEAGRVLARGPARPDLRLDLGRQLVDVDVVVGHVRSLRTPDSIARPAGRRAAPCFTG